MSAEHALALLAGIIIGCAIVGIAAILRGIFR